MKTNSFTYQRFHSLCCLLTYKGQLKTNSQTGGGVPVEICGLNCICVFLGVVNMKRGHARDWQQTRTAEIHAGTHANTHKQAFRSFSKARINALRVEMYKVSCMQAVCHRGEG